MALDQMMVFVGGGDSGLFSGGITARHRNAQQSHHVISGLVWLGGDARTSAANSYLVSYCVMMVSVFNGPAFQEWCHLISMISAKRRQKGRAP